MKTVRVELGERSYPIYIGSGLLGQSELVASHVAGNQVMLVSDETVAPLYLQKALRAFDSFQTDSLVLPDGEEHKNLEILNRIFDALLEQRHSRQTTLVALGGGVIGDITGFAAASYQRGVPFIQIPTTLLAQVDSSVGGKTGVNHPRGKNMIGAFHQPKCVLADTETLDTLDDRQLRAGLAEVIKYGLIRDSEFFGWLEQHVDRLLERDSDSLAHAIERSCINKAQVVAADELERGQRALLNLGHTFGHAIETGLGYGEWLHGEAVAAGTALAAVLSERQGWLERAEATRVKKLLEHSGLPTAIPATLEPQRMLELMAVDKKVMQGQLLLVLLKRIGEAVVTDAFEADLLRKTISDCRLPEPLSLAGSH